MLTDSRPVVIGKPNAEQIATFTVIDTEYFRCKKKAGRKVFN